MKTKTTDTTQTQGVVVSKAVELSAGTTVTVSQETLDDTPARLLGLLNGIGTLAVVRAAMAARGYDSAEHVRGWTLLQNATGYKPGVQATVRADDVAVTAAVQALDAADEGLFRVARACLKHNHPAQHDFVFNGLTASQGVAAVLGVEKFLDRLDALARDPVRKATHAEDLAALATLAKRGAHDAERARLRGLVNTAKAFSAESAVAVDPEAEGKAHESALREARAFFEEWSEIARVAVTRRDYLIRMGLAQRKKPSKKPEKTPVEKPKPE